MRVDDVPEVSRVEHRCFTNPWPESAYRRELRNPEGNYYIVLRHLQAEGLRQATEPEPRGRLSLLPLIRKSERPSTHPIVGFAGMWFLYDEAHVTTIGMTPELRGHGLGEVLLVTLFEEALQRIDKGTYGVCRDCGEPIAEARLNAIPWTRVCIVCKEKQAS